MKRLLLSIDRLSTWTGKTFSWCIVALTLAMTYEVCARYGFGAPTEWAFDASYMFYGALFMMAGAYTLARNGHVRGDFLYRSWRPRTQATVDLILYFAFFFPGMIAFVYAGFSYAKMSWLMNEHSSASPNGPPVYHFKALIPVTGVLMLLQGFAETARCVICIFTGQWPQRLHDVEELENVILEEVKERGIDETIKDLEHKGGKA